jgi:YVTN family beta-propeller protein
VTAESANNVTIFDLAKRAAVGTVEVESRPRVVVFSADGRRAYISCEIAATVLVVDTASRARIARIELAAPEKPEGTVFSPDRKSYFVATSHGNSIAVIDAATNKIESRIPVGQRPWGIAITAE